MITKIQPSDYNALDSQSNLLKKLRQNDIKEIVYCGLKIKVLPGVYKMSVDTELMVDTVLIKPNEKFLEIGCGTGIVTIYFGKRAKSGIGVDINDIAVKNSLLNAKEHNVDNVNFFQSDLFENVTGKYGVIIFNPPYSDHNASDNIDKMFWDFQNKIKSNFFKDVGKHLKKNGRIYFGWANFADIDVNLPFKLSEKNGLKLIRVNERPSSKNLFTYYVFEFVLNRN